MSVQSDAAATARYIRRHGWIQGRMKDGKGRVCLLGAISEVTNVVDPRYIRLRDAVLAELQSLPITVWNDSPGRTKDEVLAVLDNIGVAKTEPPGSWWRRLFGRRRAV